VRDVEASSRWYQHLLGCQNAHGGPGYERLISHGRLILQLHRWDVEHHHGRIGDPNITPYGNGVLLWFELDDRYLLAMAVTPAKQRQGIGRRCMEEAKRIARAWPADAIRLDAYDAAAARKLGEPPIEPRN
jgi:GNAT superfamily N-acetyltransferase